MVTTNSSHHPQNRWNLDVRCSILPSGMWNVGRRPSAWSQQCSKGFLSSIAHSKQFWVDFETFWALSAWFRSIWHVFLKKRRPGGCFFADAVFFEFWNDFSSIFDDYPLKTCVIYIGQQIVLLRFALIGTLSHWFQWSNSVQQIRFINFCFYKFLLVQIGANIMPHNNLSHFDTFGHDYW